MTENKDIWIKFGYEVFAVSGENGLKIETLAKKVGISKSSFYHHFADLEIFVEYLLKHHLQQSQGMADKEKSAKNIDPELINILVEHKIDLLFNRQLRINQQHQHYKETLGKSNQIIGNEFVKLWAKDLNLNLSQGQLESLFELALENFYLQINAENLNPTWLSAYFNNLKRIARNFV
ncbi:MAG: TetR/AcrR family transcriptional regulator [Haliscomenobacter sp.]|uniref:TetR/AcrR family transcriptional regulator n=1 Tax=Haliscomenobacter sp. TaxID=2717303 RepID=UPI0029BDD9E0|nr:TetR/AcrR family transcriptional regulator [Haliscomenobacter sp.]MDX2071111.1 TetR/AcrR family transcriptional regulator [Haliscomenobacter sp.]